MKVGRTVALLSLFVGLATLTLSGLAALADAGTETKETFAIDSVHSTALFRIKHLGAGPFYGRFNDVQGTIVFDGDKNLSLEVAVLTESVDSGNDRLDGHLKSPDFFNAREYPEMTFKSRSAKKSVGDVYEVTGDLTIHGVTKSLTVPVEWVGSADMGRGKRCGFEVIFDIKRSDFGMMFGVADGGLGDDVKVIVGLEGTLQD